MQRAHKTSTVSASSRSCETHRKAEVPQLCDNTMFGLSCVEESRVSFSSFGHGAAAGETQLNMNSGSGLTVFLKLVIIYQGLFSNAV